MTLKDLIRRFTRTTTSKSSQEKTKKVENKPSLIVYWILAGFRILLTLLPQTGYLHPDEYFQSIEVIAGHFY